VHPERMLHNLGISKGLISSEAVMMALAPSMGRQRAHDAVYAASMRAVEHDRPLRDELLADTALSGQVSAEQLDELLRPENYVGLAPRFVDRVLSARAGSPR
jgi:3-carboxy-cis,cis-muconate cycloisomerase